MSGMVINSAQHWSSVALDSMKRDFSNAAGPEITGPGRTSRLLAMVHAAFHDAYVSGSGTGNAYRYNTKPRSPPSQVLGQIAGARSALQILLYFYSHQVEVLGSEYSSFIQSLMAAPSAPGPAELQEGARIGDLVADQLRRARLADTQGAPPPFTPLRAPRVYGAHDADPISGNIVGGQPSLYGEYWGLTSPFLASPVDMLAVRADPPPRLDSREYRDNFNEVRDKGNIARRDFKYKETQLGYFWAYDGTHQLGTPPRLFNQIIHLLALSDGLTEVQWSELLCRCNLAMADAAITAWDAKYVYYLWRPIVGIRHDIYVSDPTWQPIGAPATYNTAKSNFTPSFPAYVSGHATFAAACFETAKMYRERVLGKGPAEADQIDLDIVSEELDGKAFDQDPSKLRPLIPMRYQSLDAMIQDCLESRVWLGVHWRFDGILGAKVGRELANRAYKNIG